MKRLYLLLVFILIMSGCKVIPKGFTVVNGNIEGTERLACNQLYDNIKEKWARNDSVHCYYYNQNLLSKIINNKECFIKLDTSVVIGLFGKPNKTSDYISYNLSSSCEFETDQYISEYKLILYFDDNNKIETLFFSRNQWLK